METVTDQSRISDEGLITARTGHELKKTKKKKKQQQHLAQGALHFSCMEAQSGARVCERELGLEIPGMLWEEEEVEEVVSSVHSDIASRFGGQSKVSGVELNAPRIILDLTSRGSGAGFKLAQRHGRIEIGLRAQGFFRMVDSSEPLAPGLVEPDGTLRFLQPSPGTESADPFQMCP
ncbi:uncharacterized [Tachysurus ichikawai]